MKNFNICFDRADTFEKLLNAIEWTLNISVSSRTRTPPVLLFTGKQMFYCLPASKHEVLWTDT